MRLLGLWPLLIFGCAISGGPGSERGPYLQQARADGAIVVWESPSPEDGRVEFGLGPDQLDRVAGSATRARRHEVRLEALEPSTTIYYRLVSGRGGGRFRTAPAPGTAAPTRIWVLGDSGWGGHAQREVRDAMLARLGSDPPDLLFHLGDIAYPNGTRAQLDERFFAVYAQTLSDVPVWPAFGNHDARSADAARQRGPYFDAFVLPTRGEAGGRPSGTEAYYAFDWGDLHVVVLDTTETSLSPDGAMLRWLAEDLAQHAARWTIAFFHHPPYSKGTHDSDRERRMIAVRENALPILEAGGVDLVLAGHSHSYERSALLHGAYETPSRAESHTILDDESPYDKGARGTVYVVAGHGGAPTGGTLDHPLMVHSGREHGSVLIEIDGDRLELLSVLASGGIGDRFTLRKRPAP